MNVGNLKEGMILKNYKELCEVLEEKVKTGNAKKAQLKEVERYFSYKKDGNAFIINQIYSTPLESDDGRKFGNNSLYSKDIQYLILNMLAESKKNPVVISCNSLLRKLNIVNDNYIKGRRNIVRLSEVTSVPQEYCYDFYNYTHSNLKDKLRNAMEALRKKSLIMYNEIDMVCIYKDDENMFHRAATPEEREFILDIETRIREEEFKAKDLQEIFIRGNWNKFKERVNKVVFNNYGIKYYYKGYDIVFSKENIKKELKELDRLLSEVKENLENNIYNALEKGAETRHNNALKKSEKFIENYNEDEENYEVKINPIHFNDDYVENTRILADTTIKKDAKNIDFSDEFVEVLVREYKKLSN